MAKKQKIKNLLNELVDLLFDDSEAPIIEPPIIIEEPQTPPNSIDEGKMNLGFITHWNKTNNDLSNYTHLSLAFLDVVGKGELYHKQTIDKINIPSYYKGKVGVSIGGSVDSNRIMKILDNKQYRTNFIKNVIEYCIGNNIDYINYDLEYPTQELIESLLKETTDYIKKYNLNIKISVCLACWRDFVKPYKNCNKYIDWVELMVYDDKNIIFFAKKALELLKGYGYPNNKIVIGNSLDKNGIPDTLETLAFKKSIEHLYNGKFLWEVSMVKDEPKPIIEEPGNDYWNDKWNNPHREIRSVRGTDPYDDTTTFRGNGYLWIENGIMSLSGGEPRMYVNIDVQNVEASVDYKRIGTDGANWAGCIIGVRSDIEGHGKSPEKAHTYYGRVRHDNKVDFYKEEEHSGKKTGILVSDINEYPLNNGWNNIKFRCYNNILSNSEVKLELYINDVLVLEYIDRDELMYNSKGVVFLRNTRVKQAQYKNLKINIIE